MLGNMSDSVKKIHTHLYVLAKCLFPIFPARK